VSRARAARDVVGGLRESQGVVARLTGERDGHGSCRGHLVHLELQVGVADGGPRRDGDAREAQADLLDVAPVDDELDIELPLSTLPFEACSASSEPALTRTSMLCEPAGDRGRRRARGNGRSWWSTSWSSARAWCSWCWSSTSVVVEVLVVVVVGPVREVDV
jgi:hypothetical protein